VTYISVKAFANSEYLTVFCVSASHFFFRISPSTERNIFVMVGFRRVYCCCALVHIALSCTVKENFFACCCCACCCLKINSKFRISYTTLLLSFFPFTLLFLQFRMTSFFFSEFPHFLPLSFDFFFLFYSFPQIVPA
jgi:hypothetical protein